MSVKYDKVLGKVREKDFDKSGDTITGQLIGTGTIDSGWEAPYADPGVKFLWYPRKAAFKAGYGEVVDVFIGKYSATFGRDCIAQGEGSLAFGLSCESLGVDSFAGGGVSRAIGNLSFAYGDYVLSKGYNSIAMGLNETADYDVDNQTSSFMAGTDEAHWGAIALGVATPAHTHKSGGKASAVIGQDLNAIGNNLIMLGKDVTYTGSDRFIVGFGQSDFEVYSGNSKTNGVSTATRFVSSVATGTAPLTVASTTKVPNLNAELWDDLSQQDLLDYLALTYLPLTGKAADSSLLDGQGIAYFSPASHNHNAAYLGISAKAADADLWDGNNFDDYLNQALKTTSTPTFAAITSNGRSAFYNDTTGSEGVYIARSVTNASYIVGLSSNVWAISNGASANTGSYYGLTFGVTTHSSSTQNFNGSIYGFQGFSYHDAPVTLSSAYGAKFGVRVTRTGNITTVYGAQILSGFNASASNSTVGTVVHFEINDFFKSGTNCTVNTQYGLSIKAMTSATNNIALSTEAGHVIFNENGANSDLRIEGDTDVNLFFADASADKVGIGLNNPSYKLDVNGDIRVPDGSAYYVGTSAGVSGSFTTADSKTVTVTKGIITAIV